MNLVTKKLAQSWEKSDVTQPLLMFINGSSDLSSKSFDLLGWYRRHGLLTTKARKAELAKRLGSPLYHVTYVAREAVWGFEFKSKPVLLYYSVRGLSLQPGRAFTSAEIGELLQHLLGVLA